MPPALPTTAYIRTDHELLHTMQGDLAFCLDHVWHTYFGDVPRANEVQIAYQYPWKTRLGLIRMTFDETMSFIGINALLQHPRVPEDVLIVTTAHELVHYAHGFGSPLPRHYTNPHAGSVVDRELERRGLGEYVYRSEAWIDKYWFPFYDSLRESGWAGIPGSYRPARPRHRPEPYPGI